LNVERSDRAHHPAAAAATVAHVAHVALDVVGRLREPCCLGLFQNLYPLTGRHRLGHPVSDQHVRTQTEGETDLLRPITLLSEVLLLVVTRAHPDADQFRRLHDVVRALPVEDLRVTFFRKGLLANHRAPELGLSVEDGAREAIVLIHVLVEQDRQVLHRDVFPRSHEGELEQADHDRGQGEVALSVVLEVDHESPARHLLEPVREFLLWDVHLA